MKAQNRVTRIQLRSVDGGSSQHLNNNLNFHQRRLVTSYSKTKSKEGGTQSFGNEQSTFVSQPQKIFKSISAKLFFLSSGAEPFFRSFL